MKVFGIAGYSGMGKTTLIERLVPELRSRGLAVSLIKHSHKDIDIDRPGKDSYRLREAGCQEVLLLGNARWALMHELRGAQEPPLDELLDRMARCDLVLVEGFKGGGFPKLEVWRAEVGKPTLWPQWPNIVGIASDSPRPAAGLTACNEAIAQADAQADAAGRAVAVAWLPLGDISALADFAIGNAAAR